jgi:hypothetical protein
MRIVSWARAMVVLVGAAFALGACCPGECIKDPPCAPAKAEPKKA